MRGFPWNSLGVGIGAKVGLALGMSLAMALAISGCASRPPKSQAPPPVVVTPGTGADSVGVTTSEGGTVVLDVHSSSGIGTATLAFDAVPLTALRIRFHLKGLEEMRLEYDSTAVRVAVPSSPPHEAKCSAAVGGAGEAAILQGDPRFMVVRILPGVDMQVAIPLQDGVIEVDGPLALLNGGTRTATLRWVDFFR